MSDTDFHHTVGRDLVSAATEISNSRLLQVSHTNAQETVFRAHGPSNALKEDGRRGGAVLLRARDAKIDNKQAQYARL